MIIFIKAVFLHGYYFRGKVLFQVEARYKNLNLLPTEKNLCQCFALVVTRLKVSKKLEGGDRDVGCSRACVGKPPRNPVGGDIGAGMIVGNRSWSWRRNCTFR